jgi:hypothetical protein
MYTCYDCKRFGSGCDGIIPPEEYRNDLETYCEKFLLNEWRKEMFKESGHKRI